MAKKKKMKLRDFADGFISFGIVQNQWAERYRQTVERAGIDRDDIPRTIRAMALRFGIPSQRADAGEFTYGELDLLVDEWAAKRREVNERNRVAKKRRPKGGQKKRKRGKAEDKTTQLDLGCQYVIDSGYYKISRSDLANAIRCPKSVFSSEKGKAEFAKAVAIAKQAAGQVRKGYSTDDHQAEAVIDDDWQSSIDDSIDAG